MPSSATARRATSAARAVARAGTGETLLSTWSTPDCGYQDLYEAIDPLPLTRFKLQVRCAHPTLHHGESQVRGVLQAFVFLPRTRMSGIAVGELSFLVRFLDTYFGELFSDDTHPLQIKGGVLPLLHMSIDMLSLVRLLVEVVARDVLVTYLRHRKAGAANVIIFVHERRIRRVRW